VTRCWEDDVMSSQSTDSTLGKMCIWSSRSSVVQYHIVNSSLRLQSAGHEKTNKSTSLHVIDRD
jgi:hypothetical protein